MTQKLNNCISSSSSSSSSSGSNIVAVLVVADFQQINNTHILTKHNACNIMVVVREVQISSCWQPVTQGP